MGVGERGGGVVGVAGAAGDGLGNMCGWGSECEQGGAGVGKVGWGYTRMEPILSVCMIETLYCI